MGCCGPLRLYRRPSGVIARGACGRALGRPQSRGVTVRMIGFEGRLQWRQQTPFKLHAKLLRRKKSINYKRLDVPPDGVPYPAPHPKFAIRSFLVRRTRNEQGVVALGQTQKTSDSCTRPPPLMVSMTSSASTNISSRKSSATAERC